MTPEQAIISEYSRSLLAAVDRAASLAAVNVELRKVIENKDKVIEGLQKQLADLQENAGGMGKE